MGSEMCIRDSLGLARLEAGVVQEGVAGTPDRLEDDLGHAPRMSCLLYTSDAADERSRVDLGGRRIIKKTNVLRFIVGDDSSGIDSTILGVNSHLLR